MNAPRRHSRPGPNYPAKSGGQLSESGGKGATYGGKDHPKPHCDQFGNPIASGNKPKGKHKE